jgi:hypothetical protein
MKAKDLIDILKNSPDADIYIANNERTFVVESATINGHTVFSQIK